MRCPYCRATDDRVIDSREAEDGSAVRRRRECGSCGKRYTTFERLEGAALQVVKRSGVRVPYDRAKVISGLTKACVNRPVAAEDISRVADEIEQTIRASGSAEVSSQEIGLAILDRLRDLDEVAYVRFASVYKDFQELTDFEREVGQLLQKRTPPKAGAARYGGKARRQGTAAGSNQGGRAGTRGGRARVEDGARDAGSG